MKRHTPKLSTQILEEATTWFIDFHESEPSAEELEEFTQWLRRSPEHVRAYLEITAFWEDAAALNRPGQAQIETLVARARLETNVVPLVPDTAIGEKVPDTGFALPAVPDTALPTAVSGTEPPLQPVAAITIPASAARRYVALAATIVIGLLAAGGWYIYDQRGLYATDIAEQRSLTLEDGTTVELNARSKLRVHYTDRERTIELLQGQALFKVAKNPERPFVVKTTDTSVRAVGTQFDVYRKRNGTVVTVVEGRVAVVAPKVPGSGVSGISGLSREVPTAHRGSAEETQEFSGSSRPPNRDASNSASAVAAHPTLHAELGEILVSAGEQILIAESAPPEITPDIELADDRAVPGTAADSTAVSGTVVPANIAAATAWTEKKLVFDSTPLNEVVDEFNRYNRHQLIIKDPTLNDYHISGTFPSTDPKRLLEFLTQRFGVTLTEAGDKIEITRG